MFQTDTCGVIMPKNQGYVTKCAYERLAIGQYIARWVLLHVLSLFFACVLCAFCSGSADS
jgi:hypothetical protein